MAVPEPRQLGAHTWLLPVGTNAGLWEGADGAVLIDSGNDKEAGRQIRKVLDGRGLALRLIVNTHANADHIGGNAYLQAQTGCRVAATRMEAAFIADPVLEPSFLWGALPLPALRGKFLEAKPSTVGLVIAEAGPIPGTPLEAVPLPGHYLQMIGVMTPDRVFFAADGLFGEAALAKHPVFFLYDVAGHLATLERLEAFPAEWVVPGHGEPVRGGAALAALAAANRAAVLATVAAVEAACGRTRAFEEVLAEVCVRFSIELDAAQYVLVGGTVKAFLTWLCEQGRIRPRFEGGRMLWSAGG
jgi:glyoxylase-like metal-dependent hydrolase (beta-lactamase superfamily II)